MTEEKKQHGHGLTGELNSGVKYEGKGNIPGANVGNADAGEATKEFEKLKKELDELKKKILQKYKFTRFLSILPAQGLAVFAEDEAMPREIEEKKPLLLMMCIPEEHFKDVQKIKTEILHFIKESKQNVWIMVKTEVDLWNYGLDSKFDMLDYISAGFPLHDNGFLGALRLANIHKSLVLRKFEKYVSSYVIGGSLVRGNADKDSDVDTFVIIDDTDVKRMPRVELLEKLRGIIYDYIREANALAGVKNVLNVQVYLMTDFWQSVKDAHPVMFTFIRDGVPFYDRGTFLPWKLLLKMGRIKPSPEAIDMFMKSGEQNDALVKRRMIDAMVDIYWGIVTPTQALMMLAGHAPPEPKAIVAEVKKVLVDKEKLMTMKELKILEKAVKLYKDYEHGKLNEMTGNEVDILKRESDHYVKYMKDLRGKLELRMREHTADSIHEETFNLLKQLFGSKGQDELVKSVEKELVKKGKIKSRMLDILKEVANIKKKAKGKKISQTEMQKLSADASELLSALTEYAQRKDLVAVEKGVLQVSYHNGKKKVEVVLTDSGYFLVSAEGIKKIHEGKIYGSDKKELEEALSKTKDRMKGSVDFKTLEILRKEIGDFKINF